MPQTRPYRPSLPLRPVAQSLPDTEDWIRDVTDTQTLRLTVPEALLQLVPGQPSELVVHIENCTKQTNVAWYVAITGDFPTEWLPEKAGTHPSDGVPDLEQFGRIQRVLSSGEQAQKSFRFEIPHDNFEANFFEQQGTLEPHQSQNYLAEISLFAVVQSSAEPKVLLAGFHPVKIQVRPQSSYLAFLPAIYQTSDLTGRLLAIFEQAFDPAVQASDNLWAYLDPLTAPRALLPFLAHWVAWPLDPRWSEQQTRRLLRRAVELYRWRGTRYGLRLYLHLYTGLPLDGDDMPESQKAISVVENHQTSFVLGAVSLAQQPMLGGGRPFHFTVTLRYDSLEGHDPNSNANEAAPPELDEACLRTIIDQVKPAFCTYDLVVVAREQGEMGS